MKQRTMLTGLLVTCALSLWWMEEAAAAPAAKGNLILTASPTDLSLYTVFSVFRYADGPSPSAIHRGYLSGKTLSLAPGDYYITGECFVGMSGTIDRIQVRANRTTRGTLYLKSMGSLLRVMITPSHYASQTIITADAFGCSFPLKPGIARLLWPRTYLVKALRKVNGKTYGSIANVTVMVNKTKTITMSVSSLLFVR